MAKYIVDANLPYFFSYWNNPDYIPVKYLYKELQLKPIGRYFFDGLRLNFSLKSEGQLKWLSKSISYLLWSYIWQGELVNKKFTPSHELMFYNDFKHNYNKFFRHEDKATSDVVIDKIKTDGRYYQFFLSNDSVKTIYIGFNFIERNFEIIEESAL